MKRPFLPFAVAFACGILAAVRAAFVPPAIWACLVTVLLFMALMTGSAKLRSHLFLYMAMFALGGAWYAYDRIPADDDIVRIAAKRSGPCVVRGVVCSGPDERTAAFGMERVDFTLRVEACRSIGRWHRASGMVRARLSYTGRCPVKFGDRIVMQGLIGCARGATNPGIFDYAEYLALKNISAVFRTRGASSVRTIGRAVLSPVAICADRVRRMAESLIDAHFDRLYAGFLKAITVGTRGAIDDAVNSDFVKTGTVHVIAISGLHVAIVGGFIVWIFKRLGIPRKINLICASFLVIFYTIMTGANPPIVRSAILFLSVTFAFILDRDIDPLNILSVSAFALLLVNPKELFDPSFQLSFGSVGSILLFEPRLKDAARRYGLIDELVRTRYQKMRYALVQGITVSLAAWLGTWPIILAFFSIVSPIAIAANLIIVPLSSLLMFMSSIFFVSAAVIPAALPAAAACVAICERGMFVSARLLASVPGAYITVGEIPYVYIAIYYALILLAISTPLIPFGRVYLRRKTLVSVCLIAAGACLCIDAYELWVSRGVMRVSFIDVGQGDSALIELPGNGGTVLIDAGGGGAADTFDAGKNIVSPILRKKGITTIDMLIVTHFHEDHLGGALFILENFRVRRVIDNGTHTHGALYERYRALIRKKGIEHRAVHTGDRISAARGAHFIVLNAPDDPHGEDSNESSLVLKLCYRDHAVLFCGDAAGDALNRIFMRGVSLRADVIKMPHHGGNVGGEELLTQLVGEAGAHIAIISVGEYNMYHMPSETTVRVLREHNIRLYETRYNGLVRVDVEKGIRVKPYV